MEITDDTVLSTLRAVVAERPDHVYTRPVHMLPIIGSDGHKAADCLYVHTAPDDESDLTPGCLVGTVLHRLGVPLEELAGNEGTGGFEVAADHGVSEGLCWFLGAVQSRQDSGKPWGVALASAEEDYPEVAGK